VKKILKILVPLLLILCASAYAFIPGVQSLPLQAFNYAKSPAGSSLPMSKTRKDLIDNIDLYKDFLGDMTIEDITNADNKTLTEILKKICK